jgi:hypothetical protein
MSMSEFVEAFARVADKVPLPYANILISCDADPSKLDPDILMTMGQGEDPFVRSINQPTSDKIESLIILSIQANLGNDYTKNMMKNVKRQEEILLKKLAAKRKREEEELDPKNIWRKMSKDLSRAVPGIIEDTQDS